MLFVILSCCSLGKMFFKYTGPFTELFKIIKPVINTSFVGDHIYIDLYRPYGLCSFDKLTF